MTGGTLVFLCGLCCHSDIPIGGDIMTNINRTQRRRAKQRAIRKLKRVRQAVFDKQLSASEAPIDPSVMAVIVDALRLGKGAETHGHRNGQYTDKGYKVSRSSSNRELFYLSLIHISEPTRPY